MNIIKYIKSKFELNKLLKDVNDATDMDFIREYNESHKVKICGYCGLQISNDDTYAFDYEFSTKSITYQCQSCYNLEQKYMDERDRTFKTYCPYHHSSPLSCDCCKDYALYSSCPKVCYDANIKPHMDKIKEIKPLEKIY